jgi:hypothetical protein
MRKKSGAGDYKRRSLAVVFFRKWFRIFLQVQKNFFGMAQNQASVAQTERGAQLVCVLNAARRNYRKQPEECL